MEKRPYHHKNLKNDLIEKGIELVNENGINQLSLRKVAQACNVSHAAPYSHFSNKDELLQEMQLHITKQFTAVLQDTVSKYSGTPDFLLEFGKAYISFFISTRNILTFFFSKEIYKLTWILAVIRKVTTSPLQFTKNRCWIYLLVQI